MVNIKSHDLYIVFDDKKYLFKVSSLFDSLDESRDVVDDLMYSGQFRFDVDKQSSIVWIDIFMMIELLGEYDGDDIKDLAIKCSYFYLRGKVMSLFVEYINSDGCDDGDADLVLSYCDSLADGDNKCVNELLSSDVANLNVKNYIPDEMLKVIDVVKDDNKLMSVLVFILSQPYVDDYGFFNLVDLFYMMIDNGFITSRDDVVNVLGFILKR